MNHFICFISSNICSGGKLATALVITSGAFSGGTGAPYIGGWREKGSILFLHLKATSAYSHVF